MGVGNELVTSILEEEQKEFLESLTTVEREQFLAQLAVSITTVSRRFHSGPLPSPEQLKDYDSIIPNGAERIMKMAEKQMEHRQELENRVIPGQIQQSGRGQWLGFSIGALTILCGTLCILFGHEFAGGFLGTAGLTGLVSVFVFGKNRQREELADTH